MVYDNAASTTILFPNSEIKIKKLLTEYAF